MNEQRTVNTDTEHISNTQSFTMIHLTSYYYMIRTMGSRHQRCHAAVGRRKYHYHSSSSPTTNILGMRRRRINNVHYDNKRHLSTERNSARRWKNFFLSNLKSPGGSQRLFSQPVLSSLMTRIPVSLLLIFLLNHEDISFVPFAFDFMAGPSMLPTILPVGDIYIRFNRWFLQLLPWNKERQWQVGDVVVFKDPKGNHACKRIIGVEGDKVDKLGEYVHLFQNEVDLGIRKVPMDFGNWEDALDAEEETAIIVPKGMVWVEGDNPLYSIDSRHYGPISMDSIVGKVVYRIWPRHEQTIRIQEDSMRSKSGGGGGGKGHGKKEAWNCLMNPTRPHPITEEDMFSGKYNIAKVPVEKHTT